MDYRSVCGVLVAVAVVIVARAEEAFDAEKTRALFAGSEWCFLEKGWWGIRDSIIFSKNGKVTNTDNVKGSPKFSGEWTETGGRSVTACDKRFEITRDGAQLHVSGKGYFCVFLRGTKYPPADHAIQATLAKPNTVWVRQKDKGPRETLAFNAGEGQCVSGTGGSLFYEGRYWIEGSCQVSVVGDPVGSGIWFLVRDEKGGHVLKDRGGSVLVPEPAQPDDLLPPQKTARARSPYSGTTWCRPDGKGKLHILTFAANGMVSDSDFSNEKPEWDPYDDGTVRYKVKDKKYRMLLDADKKRLVREDGKVREVWFLGRQPPKVGMIETKQLKDTLADKSTVWLHWDEGKKTVYTFDDKTANVSVTVDDGKPQVVRWEALCAGCIRIGDEAFMVEGDALERVEPRLTLKRVPKDSL